MGSYSSEAGLQLDWIADYVLSVVVEQGEVRVSGNSEGLRSLAGHLLVLAQEEVPDGVHAHLEPGLELEDGSVALVVEKSKHPV